MLRKQLKIGKNEINFLNEPAGIYFVKLKSDHDQKVMKVMVNH